MTSIVDTAALRELLEKATPGDWFTVPYGDGDSIVIHSDDEMRVFFPPVPVGYSATPGSNGDPAQIKADMELIAAARNTLPALLAEVERRRADDALVDELVEGLEALARPDGFPYLTDKEKLERRQEFARALLAKVKESKP